MKRQTLAILLTLFWMALGVSSALADTPDGPGSDALKLALGLKGRNINGRSFEVRPIVAVLNDKEATVTVHEEKDTGFVVSLTVHPKRLENQQVEVLLAFSVKASGKEVLKRTRFVTVLGQKALFSVSDDKTGEFLELEVTPTVYKK